MSGADPLVLKAAPASTRGWTLRVVDWGNSGHDDTHRGISIVEVFEVDGRATVTRGDTVELRDGRNQGETDTAAAQARLAKRISMSGAALRRPVLHYPADIVVRDVCDWPTDAEQGESIL